MMWVNGPSCGFACMLHTCKLCISMNVMKTTENLPSDSKMTTVTILTNQKGVI